MAQTDAVARFEGEPLLGEAGMEAISLLQDPETARGSILARKGFGIEKVIEEDGVNPVYVVALKSVLNAEWAKGLSLAQPANLRMADTTSKSMIALDQMLRASEDAQPVVLFDRGISHTLDANVFVGVTRPGEGLDPGTSRVPQRHYSGGGLYMADRDSWALPVDPSKIAAFYIDSDTAFGPNDPILGLLNEDETVAPGLQEDVAHAFELIPEEGETLYALEPSNTISFDEDGEVVEVKAALETGHRQVHLAVGRTSVERALQELHEVYLAKPGFEEKEVDEHERMFSQLTQFALGETGLPARPYMIPAPQEN